MRRTDHVWGGKRKEEIVNTAEITWLNKNFQAAERGASLEVWFLWEFW